ncbi:MAG: hypothetical protein OCD00_18250 [Colwellia sp.]
MELVEFSCRGRSSALKALLIVIFVLNGIVYFYGFDELINNSGCFISTDKPNACTFSIIKVLIFVFFITLLLIEIIKNSFFCIRFFDNKMAYHDPARFFNKSFELEFTDIWKVQKVYGDETPDRYYIVDVFKKKHQLCMPEEKVILDALSYIEKLNPEMKVTDVHLGST